MKKSVFVVIGNALLFTVSSAFAAGVTWNAKYLKSFDENEWHALQKSCEESKTSIPEWLKSEISTLSLNSLNVKNKAIQTWEHELKKFTVAGEPISAEWVSGSIGTFGTYNSKIIEKSPEEISIRGGLVDVGTGEETNIAKLDHIDGKYWLVAESENIPDPKIISLQAQLHHALGLLLFRPSNFKAVRPETEFVSQIPILKIDLKAAQKLKDYLKKQSPEVELSLSTVFPGPDQNEFVMTSTLTSVPNLVVFSDDECASVASALEAIKWVSALPIRGDASVSVIFSPKSVYSPGQAKIRNLEYFDSYTAELDWKIKGQPDLIPLLRHLFDGVQINNHPLSSRKGFEKGLSGFEKQLLGIVDLDKIHSLKEALNKSRTQSQRFRKKESLFKASVDLHVLQNIFQLVQKGQWDLAKKKCSDLTGFKWAGLVPPNAFADYRNILDKSSDISPDPKIWVFLNSNREGSDSLLKLLRSEIDRYSQFIETQFTEVQKQLAENNK
jgi:hypothetical protein